MTLKQKETLIDKLGKVITVAGTAILMNLLFLAACIPVAITAVCLLMMFLSKKTLYPWLISVFSLVLPLVIWFSNVFPN